MKTITLIIYLFIYLVLFYYTITVFNLCKYGWREGGEGRVEKCKKYVLVKILFFLVKKIWKIIIVINYLLIYLFFDLC